MRMMRGPFLLLDVIQSPLFRSNISVVAFVGLLLTLQSALCLLADIIAFLFTLGRDNSFE